VADEGKPGLCARNPRRGRVGVRARDPSRPLRPLAVATELPTKNFPNRFRWHALGIEKVPAVEMIGRWSGIGLDAARGHLVTRLAPKCSFRQGGSRGAASKSEFLTFRPCGGLRPHHFSERHSFRSAARSTRPEVNARQRCAPSGANVFGQPHAQEPRSGVSRMGRSN
jgi:hypothetical protein